MFDLVCFEQLYNYTIYSGYEMWPVNDINPFQKEIKTGMLRETFYFQIHWQSLDL
jgi:hypothetical protein